MSRGLPPGAQIVSSDCGGYLTLTVSFEVDWQTAFAVMNGEISFAEAVSLAQERLPVYRAQQLNDNNGLGRFGRLRCANREGGAA